MSFSHFPLKPQKRFEQTGATEATFSQHLQERAGLTQQKDPSLPTGLGQRLPDERVLAGAGRGRAFGSSDVFCWDVLKNLQNFLLKTKWRKLQWTLDSEKGG